MKEIIIKFEQTLNENGEYDLETHLETKGNISPFELLGLLRHFEKTVWLRIATDKLAADKTQKTD